MNWHRAYPSLHQRRVCWQASEQRVQLGPALANRNPCNGCKDSAGRGLEVGYLYRRESGDWHWFVAWLCQGDVLVDFSPYRNAVLVIIFVLRFRFLFFILFVIVLLHIGSSLSFLHSLGIARKKITWCTVTKALPRQKTFLSSSSLSLSRLSMTCKCKASLSSFSRRRSRSSSSISASRLRRRSNSSLP